MGNYFGRSGRKLTRAIWAVSCLTGMVFGYNQAVAGGVLTTRSFQQQFPQIDTVNVKGAEQQHRATIQGTVVALYTLCGFFGAMACTFFGDKWGRRKAIFCASAIQLVGVILMGTSFELGQFIVSRIVLGLGTGGIVATTSMWQSELSKSARRGEHVCGFGLSCGFGVCLALWIDLACHFANNSFAWRFPFLLQAIPITIVLFAIFTVPESPRWLVKMNRLEEAREIFSRVYEEAADSETVNLQIKDIQLSLQLAQNATLRAVFTNGRQRTFHRLILAAAIQMFLQMTGAASVTTYGSTIFEQYLGFDTTVAEILSASSQITIIFGALLTAYTVDRYGRRTLLITSSVAMAICQACLTGLASHPSNTAALKAAILFIFLYNFSYSIGYLGIPFLYASEIAPMHLRAAVFGIATATSWLFNFLVVEITPVAFQSIGYRYFIVYMCINIFCAVVIFVFYPETAGRSMEEIDEIFASSKGIFDPVKVARKLPRKHLSEFLVEEGKVDLDALQLEKAPSLHVVPREV